MSENLFGVEKVKNHYEVLARKYRPRLFADVLSQEHLVRIIKNSIKRNKVHHAYVLTGIRGVGKTSFARILAKALNCREKNEDTQEPCLKCKDCISVERGLHQDVIEIDAASNTGVSDIREIIENAKYKPIVAEYKIYIIDEVHMLSNSAFNALLKTLEEPPEHIKFILASTEIKKIIPTVLSRCQRLDFYRFSVSGLANYLKSVAKLEGKELGDKSAKLLAKAAEGSARDGLSLLDQAIIISEKDSIEEVDIYSMLGIINVEAYYDVFDSIISGNVKDSLERVKDLYDKGIEAKAILEALSDLVHKVTLYSMGGGEELADSDHEIEFCKRVGEHFSSVDLLRLWHILSKSLVDIKSSYNEFFSLQMCLVKIMHINLLISPEDLLKSKTEVGVKISQVDAEVKKKSKSLDKIEDLLKLLEDKMEITLYHAIRSELSIIKYSEGEIVVDNINNNKLDTAVLKRKLLDATGVNWNILVDDSKKGVVFQNEKNNEEDSKRKLIEESDLMKEMLKKFPDTEIQEILVND
ncbi:MAG: DNA polymerase-3 subunit gamma/tau [Candidatus Midichloriaceae bacterium]|jgi:DNA polymerase-3 subunit gamma/tau